MQNTLLLLVSVILFFSCGTEKSGTLSTADLNLIPQPQSVNLQNSDLDISNGLKFVTNLADSQSVALQEYLGEWISYNENGKTQLQLTIDETLPTSNEGYSLSVHKKGVTIKANNFAGIFYGVQTLSQLLEYNSNNATTLPYIDIEDEPRFAYRGFMLDVSRHFFPISFLKKQIDMMSHYKLNTFHWHLTDGPGWRLEIKQYPELTSIAAWRTHETWKEWWATSPRKYVKEGTEGAHGGYYTQDEVRDFLKYAAQRNITVIPEIEMPGHSEEVMAVYPQLSCTGIPYTSSEFCIGNEETFSFLENVLTEVIDLFPSQYIHIGGDEASREHWKKCPKCQARIKAENLTDENELQSYMIKRIEKFLHSKGRRLLGWDEILEGGLAPDATVMSWRGKEGGIKAVKIGHQAIMTPGEFCYFDSYQANPDTQPEALGGFLPIEKVYSYNPVPDSLATDEANRILGVQANLWVEYVPTTDHVEYMAWPRLLALAEVAWTQPESKDWENFKVRANRTIPYLQKKGFNAFTLSDEVAFSHDINSDKKGIVVTLSTEKAPAEIRYTTDNSQPTTESHLYTEPIIVNDSITITAQVFADNATIGKPIIRRFDYHQAIGKKVIYNIPINKYYAAAGENSLIDGLNGGLAHGDGRWQGFVSNGMDVTIDMGAVVPLKYISGRFMQSVGPQIYFPSEVVISVSNDNTNFTEVARIKNTVSDEEPGTLLKDFGWQGATEGQYIRYQGLPNKAKGGWAFVDEIVVW